jgi:hypothetical protein
MHAQHPLTSTTHIPGGGNMDTNKIRYGFAFMLGAIAAGLNPAAMAADAAEPVTATATIDWSRLQLSVTGINGSSPTVLYENQHTSVDSNAWTNVASETNSRSISNWTDTAQANADAGTTFANAIASTLDFSGRAVSDQSGYSNSSGSRTLDFSLDGPGVLTVTVPYSLTLTGDVRDCYYCYGYGNHAAVSAQADFYSNSNDGSANSHSNASFSLYNDYWHSSPDSQSGTLVFGIFASGAGTGHLALNFDLSTQSSISPIPEPESYAMLLAGLGLIGMIVRRRNIYRAF